MEGTLVTRPQRRSLTIHLIIIVIIIIIMGARKQSICGKATTLLSQSPLLSYQAECGIKQKQSKAILVTVHVGL
jgi:uncharacterized membrane protein YkgB